MLLGLAFVSKNISKGSPSTAEYILFVNSLKTGLTIKKKRKRKRILKT